MFANLKQIFNNQNKDLRKRIYFTLACLFIFKLGTTIIVPGIDKDSLGTDNLGFLELINVMGGGAMEKFSIFSLSSIISEFILVICSFDVFILELYISIDEFNFQEKDIKVSSNIERNGKIVRRIPYREEGLELK